jgi:hypothetical protein
MPGPILILMMANGSKIRKKASILFRTQREQRLGAQVRELWAAAIIDRRDLGGRSFQIAFAGGKVLIEVGFDEALLAAAASAHPAGSLARPCPGWRPECAALPATAGYPRGSANYGSAYQ